MLAFAIVAVHVALLATPEAQQTEESGSSAGRCAVFGKSPPPARLEGRVVSRDRTPLRDIHVRVTLPETGSRYTTVSDGEGRFTFGGFYADAWVDLELEDAVRWVGTRCSVRLTRHAPEKKLVVVLDRGMPGSTEPEIGCEGVPSSSWASSGPVRFFSRDEERAMFGPREEPPPPVRLDLRARDIVAVRWSREGADVQMNEAAAREIEAFTEANVGRWAVVTIGGMRAWSATIQGPIGSGSMWLSEDALRGPLCKTIEEAETRSRH